MDVFFIYNQNFVYLQLCLIFKTLINMSYIPNLLVFFWMFLIPVATSESTGELKNYQCKKCGTLIQSDRYPSVLGCPSGGSHQWYELGAVGFENYQCSKCGTHVENQKSPSVLGCPSGGSHQWYDLGKMGSNNYLCNKCGLWLKSEKYPSVLGCPSGGTHQWHKLN